MCWRPMPYLCRYMRQHWSTILNFVGLSSPVRESYQEHYSKPNVSPEKGRLLYAAGKVNLDDEAPIEEDLPFDEYVQVRLR